MLLLNLEEYFRREGDIEFTIHNASIKHKNNVCPTLTANNLQYIMLLLNHFRHFAAKEGFILFTIHNASIKLRTKKKKEKKT